MNKERDINREGDLVLIHYQEKPMVYGRIEAIGPDVKKDWYQVTLLLLTIPAQTVVWILREEYINGSSFTMGGQSMRLEKIKRFELDENVSDPVHHSTKESKGNPSKIIPLKKRS